MRISKSKIFFIVFLLFVSLVNAQVVADFEAVDSIGCNSLVTTFVNNSQGTNLQYTWDFGNGTSSTQQSPSAVYTALGSYTVILIVSDGVETDTLKKINYIHVYQSPSVSFSTESPRMGCEPLTVVFTSQIEQGDAQIMTALWDFGDGESSTEINPIHDFTGVGTYNVSLYIQDSNFCESSFIINDYITTTPKPNANFVVNDNLSCFDTLTAIFTDNSSGETQLEYFWDFGDGNASNEANPQHLYTEYGLYTVQLNVVDDYGCEDSLIRTDYIKMQELNLEFEIADNFLCKYENMTIENSTSGASSYYWDFGDGTFSTQETPIKFYTDTGRFEITYIAALQSECSDTLTGEIFVDRVTANFNTDINYVCELPTEIKYFSTSEFAVDWEWHIGIDYTSDHEDAEYVLYDTEALPEIKDFYITDTLIVSSEQGCTDTTIVDSNIYVSIPKVYFTPNDTAIYDSELSGCIPITVNFEDRSIVYHESDPLVSWEWDFGDSQTSSIQSPTHIYDNTGTYEILMTATNSSGCKNFFTAELIAGTPQNALFEYVGEDSICGSEKAQFNDLSEDSELVNGWIWQFSDGSASTLRNPNIQFSDTGYIEGVLTVLYNNCIGSTFAIDSVVYVKGPAGNLVSDFSCDSPLSYTLTSDIRGTDSWVWDFGDNTYDSTSVQEIIHDYDTTGNYTVRLIAENSATTCALSREKVLLVRQVGADFDYSPKYNCIYDSIWFNPLNSIDADFFSYEGQVGFFQWNFKDTSAILLTEDTVAHFYTEPGDYAVELIVRATNRCYDTLVKNVHIYDLQPSIQLSDSMGCVPFTVEFSDISTADTTISEWLWDFGDGDTSMEQHPSHTFTSHNNFDITLQLTDIFGCYKSLVLPAGVYASKPVAKFTSPNAYHCFGDSIQFNNTSFSEGLTTFSWSFGDFETSEDVSPKHRYADTGFYSVTLYLTDSIGCDTFTQKEQFAYVQPIPEIDFYANAQSSICYPKIIGFSDSTLSNDLVNWFWDFGDNETIESSQHPFHTYQLPGNYDVSLTAFTSLGCHDSLVKENFIQINGPIAEINVVDSACVNTLIEVSMENASGIDYFEWNTDDGQSFYTESFENSYDAAGVKKIYLTISSGSVETCQKFYTDSIIIPELTAVFSVSDTANCVPYSVDFLESSVGYTNFQWYNNNEYWGNESGFSYLFDTDGLYEIKLLIENGLGCRDSLEKNIQVYPLPKITINNDTLICQYDTIDLKAAGGNQYKWYQDGELIDKELPVIQIFPQENSLFKVLVTDSNMCESVDSVLVEVQPKPIQNTGYTADTMHLIIGEQFDFAANFQYADYFLWEPSSVFSCDNCEFTTLFPLESQYVYLKSYDNNNCFTISDSIYIAVDEKYSLDIPNAFSPNNDGVNDVIEVKGWGIKQVVSFKVFNSKGQKVYETNDENPQWDGYSNLGKQPSGLYLYEVIIVSYDNQERVQTGYIYLLN